jgi:hypothetical protein
MYVAYAKNMLIFAININIYCYAFLNLETQKIYISMFIQMFQILKDIDEFSTYFSHIFEKEKEI